MTVQELREALAAMPGHWPVHVEVRADGSGGGAGTDYLYTLDVQRDNFPTQGNMAVIRIDEGFADPSKRAQEDAWQRAKRKFPEGDAASVSALEADGQPTDKESGNG
jgi:hypothetical protein